jgi:hypothetical protein
MPEPTHGVHQGSADIPLPPRSSQRFSQAGDFGGGHAPTNNHLVSPLQASYNNNDGPYHNQGIYAGGHNPYPNARHVSNGYQRPYSDPFTDPTSPRQSDHSRNSVPSGAVARDPELFLNNYGAPQDNESNWPLRGSEEREWRNNGRPKSYDRYYGKAPVYEM